MRDDDLRFSGVHIFPAGISPEDGDNFSQFVVYQKCDEERRSEAAIGGGGRTAPILVLKDGRAQSKPASYNIKAYRAVSSCRCAVFVAKQYLQCPKL